MANFLQEHRRRFYHRLHHLMQLNQNQLLHFQQLVEQLQSKVHLQPLQQTMMSMYLKMRLG